VTKSKNGDVTSYEYSYNLFELVQSRNEMNSN